MIYDIYVCVYSDIYLISEYWVAIYPIHTCQYQAQLLILIFSIFG